MQKLKAFNCDLMQLNTIEKVKSCQLHSPYPTLTANYLACSYNILYQLILLKHFQELLNLSRFYLMSIHYILQALAPIQIQIHTYSDAYSYLFRYRCSRAWLRLFSCFTTCLSPCCSLFRVRLTFSCF